MPKTTVRKCLPLIIGVLAVGAIAYFGYGYWKASQSALPDGIVSGNGRIEAKLGDHFFVSSGNSPFYILGGVVFLDAGPGMNRARFPGGLKVSLNPGDRAVYIGTLRYHRDEFFEITRVAVVDEYGAAQAEFTKKFGAGVPLRKALMTPSK
mgnify:FL=1